MIRIKSRHLLKTNDVINTKEKKPMFKISGSMLLFLALIGFVIGGCVFPYVINTWAGFFGAEPQCAFWQGGLLGIIPIINTHIMIPSLIVTWIFDMFVDKGDWTSGDNKDTASIPDDSIVNDGWVLSKEEFLSQADSVSMLVPVVQVTPGLQYSTQ